MSFKDDVKFNIKLEHKACIDNAPLMEPRHEFRMKDLAYGQDFYLLPKFVFRPFSKWYDCDKIITRQVIMTKSKVGLKRMDSMRSSHSHRFMMSSQKFYNPAVEEFEEEFVRTVGDTVYELELYPRLVYLGKVTEKGEKLHKKAIVNKQVDQNYLVKVLKTDNIPFKEVQLSKKTTLFNVLQIAAKHFDENPKKGRLLIEDAVISGRKLFMNLEEYGTAVGQLIYAEFQTASNEWPTEKYGENGFPK